METIVKLMRRSDLPAVLRMEQECFEVPWTESQFHGSVRSGVVFWIALRGGSLCGFVGYTRTGFHADLLTIAVAPYARRVGVGTMLLDRALHGADTVGCMVSDHNDSVQLFLRARGFRAVRVLRKYYNEDEDGYSMEWKR